MLACAVIVVFTIPGLRAADRPLNVLFIAADDLNCSVGCYGAEVVQTPNIDRLAKRGLIFNRAYCQQAVCNPSRASLLSGLRPDTIRVWDLRTDFRTAVPDAVTLPQHFRNHGYETRCIGKIFHNMGDLNDGPSWSAPAVYHQGRHSDDYALPENSPDRRTGKGPPWEDGELPDNAYLDGKIANLAVETLGELHDRPFFLAVGFWRPHLPFLAPDSYWRRYDPQALPLPSNLQPPTNVPQIALHDSRELRGYTGMPATGPVSTADHHRLMHGYYAGISYLDAQLGKVLDELDRLGLSDRTVIVFWSDHGYHLGEQSLWCKTSNFELDARVPLIIAPPDFEHAGQRTDALVELIDVYPTLCSLCGFAPPEQIEGTSLAPVLSNLAATVKEIAVTQHPRPAYYRMQPDAMGYSLRTDRFRYTAWFDWTTHDVVARELYDHDKDPDETMNLADDSGFADDVERLHATLLEAVTPLPGPE